MNEILSGWIDQYGDLPALVRGLPNDQIKYLVVVDPSAMIEGETLPLVTADPGGDLYAKASQVLHHYGAYNANREDDEPERHASLRELIEGQARL